MAEPEITSKETGAEEAPEEREVSKLAEKPGRAFFGAFLIVLLLVFLILFANIPGMRASAGLEMTKHSWILQSYADSSGTLIEVIPGATITARFGTDGRVQGSGGCNSYSGPYYVNEYGIRIGSLIRTDEYCPSPGIMQQETDVLNDLPRASIFGVSEKQLKIYNETGKPVLVFESDDN